jgi:hypothetical protein
VEAQLGYRTSINPTELAAVDSAIHKAQIGRIAIRVLPTVDPAPPQLAHIKLGHLLVCPSRPQLRELTDFIAQCSYHVDARLTFEDVYTPLGRIGLGRVRPV